VVNDGAKAGNGGSKQKPPSPDLDSGRVNPVVFPRITRHAPIEKWPRASAGETLGRTAPLTGFCGQSQCAVTAPA
jgi:hypothetical protein